MSLENEMKQVHSAPFAHFAMAVFVLVLAIAPVLDLLVL